MITPPPSVSKVVLGAVQNAIPVAGSKSPPVALALLNVNTVGSQIGSSISNLTNQQNNRL